MSEKLHNNTSPNLTINRLVEKVDSVRGEGKKIGDIHRLGNNIYEASFKELE